MRRLLCSKRGASVFTGFVFILFLGLGACSSPSSGECSVDSDCPNPDQACIDQHCIGGDQQEPLADDGEPSNSDDGGVADGGADEADVEQLPCELTCPVSTHCVRQGDTSWCENDAGDQEGPYQEEDEQGQVLIEGQYEDGDMEGTWRYYDADGNLRREENYVDGVTNGPYKTWYASGQVETEANNLNGKLDGAYRSYFENGQIEKEGAYQQGLACGTWTYYFEDGQIDRVEEADPCT